MSKMYFVLVVLLSMENVDKIFQKIEEICHMSSYDIAKKLNIDCFGGICVRLDT